MVRGEENTEYRIQNSEFRTARVRTLNPELPANGERQIPDECVGFIHVGAPFP